MATGSSAFTSFSKKSLEHLNQIVRKPKLNIEFQNLKYSVRDSSVTEGWLQILNSVSGKFRCGELTAILGPSGAGKTSLLNVLAGFITSGVQGDVNINNYPRDLKAFGKLSSYIMQETIVQPLLTVEEAMMYAALLKLGSRINQKDIVAMVEEVLNFLGLEGTTHTRSESLSGGEKKRLSIALELVNNPPVIFLDEPTAGLDNFAVKQCIDLLKKISDLDRTVVCTIHQPPSSIFQSFDQVYILANGSNVYNGSPSQLVPFFTRAGYSCPLNYTPTDYMIELVYSDFSTVTTFKTMTQNGKMNVRETAYKDPISEVSSYNEYLEFVQVQDIETKNPEFAASYVDQVLVLLSRLLLQTGRNRKGICIQVLHHVFSGLAVGLIFTGVGNKANELFTILKFCVCCVVYVIYSHIMMPILLLPFELQLLKREYFNRWYSLKAYYTAWTIANGPPLVILCIVFAAFSYFLSDQPQETSRFISFCLIMVSVGLTAQGLGFVIGTVCRATDGAIVGPVVLTMLLTTAIYGMGFEANITPFFKFLLSLTFLRDGLVGLCSTLFYQRGRLDCEEETSDCPYTQGDYKLIQMSVPITDYKYYLGYIIMFMVIFRIAGYLLLKYKLNVDLSLRILYYFRRLIVNVNCKNYKN